MFLFNILVLTIVAIILLLSLLVVRYLARGKWLALLCIMLVLLDVCGVGYMVLNARELIGQPQGTLFVATIITLFVAQCITLMFTVLAVIISRLWRAMLRTPVDESRRRVLKGGLCYPLISLGISGYGALYERTNVVRHDYIVPVAGLTQESELTIGQISDVHLGAFFSNEDFRNLLELVVESGADLLAVTGDIFDDEKQNSEAIALLGSYVPRFPKGIWFCLGNHEYFRGAQKILKELRQTPVKVLVNEASRVDGTDIYIAGVDYPMARDEGFTVDKARFFERAIAFVPEKAPTVLLAHHPDFIDNAAEHKGVALTLSGHTHGGQFGFLGMPLFPVFKYMRGLYQVGNSYGYVHTGNGSWFPIRIGCPPEVAYFKLVKNKN